MAWDIDSYNIAVCLQETKNQTILYRIWPTRFNSDEKNLAIS